MEGTVLVADDDATIRKVLSRAFSRAGCRVHATALAGTLMRWVKAGTGDLVISDIVLPDGNGLQKLREIRECRPDLPIILISARKTVMTAIRAEEGGAYAYLPKPFDLHELLRRAAEALKYQPETRTLQMDSQNGTGQLPLVGSTPGMLQMYQLLARVMNADVRVHLTGESGTGKTLVARTIHNFGNRRGLPLVEVSALDLAIDGIADLFARAAGGTLIFENISSLEPKIQASLVDALDTGGSTGPRIISTALSGLEEALEQGRFRSDLYYRLCGVLIPLPPLRERLDDIPLLASRFVQLEDRQGIGERSFSDGALSLLKHYAWPGNVRQLRNLCRQLLMTEPELLIKSDAVSGLLRTQPLAVTGEASPDSGIMRDVVRESIERYFDLHNPDLPAPGLYRRVLREVELPLISTALEAAGGNQVRCAALLGMNRNTLRKKLVELDITPKRRRSLR